MYRVMPILCLFLLLIAPLWAEPALRVGVVPVQLIGDYQPLSALDTTDTLIRAFQEQAPDVEFVLLENSGQVVFASQALEVAKKAGVELIVWGDVRFAEGADPSRQPYYRGRLDLYLSTEADLQVLWAAENKLVLTEPTWVSTNRQTQELVTGAKDYSVEQTLAANTLVEVAKAVVQVLRNRKKAGWFHPGSGQPATGK